MLRNYGSSVRYYFEDDDGVIAIELNKNDFITLSIDGGQRGVGGDMPGCAYLHKPYKLSQTGKHSFSFIIEKID